MTRAGERLGRTTLRRLLRRHKLSLKSNVKHLSPREHPDRDRQFQYIQARRRSFEAAGWPILSVDTKKRELIGPFKSPGRIWCERAPEVYTHDFPHHAKARAIPYGVYDVQAQRGHIYVGVSADTPDFAVEAIVRWWQRVGRRRYPDARQLLLLADGGGSNGYRARRWKYQLQERLSDAFGLRVTVCHYPPGASKWNPIEHRLFSQISQTWAGTPLTSLEVMLEGIRATRTATGLRVGATLVKEPFPRGLRVTPAQMAALSLLKHAICPRWNYTLRPRNPRR